MGPIDSPKTSVQNYHSVLRKILKEHISNKTLVESFSLPGIIRCLGLNGVSMCPAGMQWSQSPETVTLPFNCSHLFSAAHILELYHPATV
jgi:hypothetical protein